MKLIYLYLSIFIFSVSLAAQTKDAYETSEKTNTSLFDKSRLSVQHSLSFGMASNLSNSNLKSQSLYGTMLQYQFVAPVTVKLNFALPIHSTFSSTQNLNVNNVQSLDYFKSMPFDFNLTWQPTDKMQLRFSIVKANYQDQYYGYWPGRNNYSSPFFSDTEEDE